MNWKPFAIACLLPLLALPASAQQTQVVAAEGGQLPADSPATFIIGIGTGYSNFTGTEEVNDDRFTTTDFVMDESGFDFSLSGEFVFMSWLGVGLSYERIREVTFDQDFDVVGFPFTAQIRDGTFDPYVVELYAVPFLQVHPLIRVFGTIGVAHWKSDSEASVVLLFQGDELDSETVTRENDGTTGIFGAGIDVWPHPRVGLRVGYKYIKLQDGEEVDEAVHNARFMALFRF